MDGMARGTSDTKSLDIRYGYLVKIGNLKKKNRDHKKYLKKIKDTGYLQILLHLRLLFDCM